MSIIAAVKFKLPLSTIPGLLDGADYRVIHARRDALVYHIQMCYFPVFKRARLGTVIGSAKMQHDNQRAQIYDTMNLKLESCLESL